MNGVLGSPVSFVKLHTQQTRREKFLRQVFSEHMEKNPALDRIEYCISLPNENGQLSFSGPVGRLRRILE